MVIAFVAVGSMDSFMLLVPEKSHYQLFFHRTPNRVLVTQINPFRIIGPDTPAYEIKRSTGCFQSHKCCMYIIASRNIYFGKKCTPQQC